MNIEFSEQVQEGTVSFHGVLTKDEVDFLLRYALLSLLSRGMLPQSLSASLNDVDLNEETPPEQIN